MLQSSVLYKRSPLPLSPLLDMANDIRRQTSIDLTNALCSARRLERVLRETPRYTQEGSAAHGAEVEAQMRLDIAAAAIDTARTALEELDTF